MKLLRGFWLSTSLGGLLSVAVWAASPWMGADSSSGSDEPLAPVQIFVVRHAEKNSDDPRDPGLSPVGQQRAAELRRVLRRAGVTHLFSSEYKRTRDTLLPLAEELGLEVEVVSAGKARDQVARLRELPAGSVAVVAGHSNTVPALIQALGAKADRLVQTTRGPMLKEEEYDRLFLVSLPAQTAEGSFATHCTEMAYGAH